MSPSDRAGIACIGGGSIGRAWAVVFARAGHHVRIYDIDEAALSFAKSALDDSVSTLAALGEVESESALLERVEFTTSLEEAVEHATHVQENVPEQLETKRPVIASLARHCPADVTIASSTSELLPSSFLQDVDHPERCMVAHPVNPPSLIPLVEICPAPETSELHIERVASLMQRCGMTCIKLKKEVSGFLLNRIQGAVLGEAFSLIQQGYCTPEDIDLVVVDGLARRWSFIGPLTTGHLNANNGFSQYIQNLGSTWQAIIGSMRTDVTIDQALVDRVSEAMESSIAVDEVRAAQGWRDRRLAALAQHLRAEPAFGKST